MCDTQYSDVGGTAWYSQGWRCLFTARRWESTHTAPLSVAGKSGYHSLDRPGDEHALAQMGGKDIAVRRFGTRNVSNFWRQSAWRQRSRRSGIYHIYVGFNGNTQRRNDPAIQSGELCTGSM